MAANCERMVAEINIERKQKTLKAKPKASEGRMHLTNIRVVQRNLVYIIGLPLNLANEEASTFAMCNCCDLLEFAALHLFCQNTLCTLAVWPIWEGFESFYISNSKWGYSTFFK
ncbi:hypothetical protein Q3G72_025977 [Acer saccharum]|nr:hypothetical protein Q3G72_025977 [Acer saccharum]